MKEEFLHYLWKYKLYDYENLVDSEGNKITVINPGSYNRDSGPDFFNARIITGNTTWAGNIEIHISASDFDAHGHQNDPAYNNLILHVVCNNDKKIFNSRGEELPAAVISFDTSLYERYVELINNPFVIACQEDIQKAGSLLISHYLNSLAIERLEQKIVSVLNMLDETGNDWDEVFYRMLCRYFGFRVNSEPFELLARNLPFKIIRKHSDNLLQIEALLFGSAGLLEAGLFRDALTDDYYNQLIKEFRILAAKYSIRPMHGWIWKFSRLRPVNFPTIRLSQLAAMLTESGGIFSRILDINRSAGLKALFEVPASAYWEEHYVFGRKSSSRLKRTGSLATDIIIINAVVPVLFAYGRLRDRQDLCDSAISLLEETKPEKNVITGEWLSTGLKAENAFQSQALIQLRNEYCRKRRCLECRIGNQLISSGNKLKDDDQLILEP